jgi:diketogulonate reductase-like aldo/keto reductase
MGLPITADNWIPKDKDGNIKFSKVSLEQTWHAMEEVQKMGLVKSIGVSNYSIVNMLDLFSYCKVSCFYFQGLF